MISRVPGVPTIGLPTESANIGVAVLCCDLCGAEFAFALVKSEGEGRRALFHATYDHMQAHMVRFCPLCGARNTAVSERERLERMEGL